MGLKNTISQNTEASEITTKDLEDFLEPPSNTTKTHPAGHMKGAE